MNYVESNLSFLISTLVVAILSYFLIKNIVKSKVTTFLLVLLKFSPFVIYFLFWSHYRPVVLIDDQTYFRESIELFESSDGAILSLFSPEKIVEFKVTAGGFHIGYYIYNYICFYFLGPYYYSPVLINILLTVISSILLFKTFNQIQTSKKFNLFFFLFFLLHWDIYAWFTVLNIKDSVVLFLECFVLYNFIVLLNNKFSVVRILLIILALFVLSHIRFYFVQFLTVSMLISFFVFLFKNTKSWLLDYFIKISVLIVLPICFYFLFIQLYAVRLERMGATTNVLFGFIRFTLTPIPFNIDPEYSFLLISSFLHWSLLLIIPIGLYLFIKKYFYILTPFLVFFLLLCVFYGSFAELQGPRHRVPQIPFLAIIQSLAIYEILAKVKREKLIAGNSSIRD